MASLQFGDPASHSQPVMTAQEAEEVIALWAQRQQQGEQLDPLPSVKELSEVLNAPPAEVMALLDQVRNRPQVQPRVRRKLNFKAIRIPAAVGGILMLMVVAGGIGFTVGFESRGARLNRYSVPAFQSTIAPPASYSVSFDGYGVPGSGPAPASDAELMADLETSTRSVVDVMSPRRDLASGTPISSEDFMKNLDAGKAVPGLLEFRQATLKGLGRKVDALIPILVRDEAMFSSVVREEQSRRIKQLVSALVLGAPSK